MVSNFCRCILVVSNRGLYQAKTAKARRIALVEDIRAASFFFKLEYENEAVVVLILQNTQNLAFHVIALHRMINKG